LSSLLVLVRQTIVYAKKCCLLQEEVLPNMLPFSSK
jgi:hypothetical protein